MQVQQIFKEDFQAGIQQNYWDIETGAPHSVKLQDPMMPKPSWVRFELRKSDPVVRDSSRAELALKDYRPLTQEVRVYGVTTFLPKSGDEEYKADVDSSGKTVGQELIFQWHNVPDSNSNKEYIEPWTTPPLALRTTGNKYSLCGCWDDAKVTSNEKMKNEGKCWEQEMDSFLPDLGVPVNWRIEVVWGWLPEHNAYIKIWKNGVLWFAKKGPNITNDQQAPIFKIGIYKWQWGPAATEAMRGTLDRRVIYYSNIFAG